MSQVSAAARNLVRAKGYRPVVAQEILEALKAADYVVLHQHHIADRGTADIRIEITINGDHYWGAELESFAELEDEDGLQGVAFVLRGEGAAELVDEAELVEAVAKAIWNENMSGDDAVERHQRMARAAIAAVRTNS